MGLLCRKELLQKEKLEIVKVDLGIEEGVEIFVYVTQMTGRERDQFERSLMRETKDMQGKVSGYVQALEDFRAKLAVVTMCDEDGKLLLEPRDVATLSQSMSAVKLQKIADAASRLNGISEEDKEALTKNSEVGPADNSSSDSAESLE
jgi:hypothetical protein